MRPAGVLMHDAGRVPARHESQQRGRRRHQARVSDVQQEDIRSELRAAVSEGLNGIMVWKANNVWVQNLTACNFLHGSGDTGNEIWWNGGHGSKKGGIGGHGFIGSYLNATSTFFKNEKTAAQYGIFSSNWNGGTWDQTYASNFNDSGYYIGACLQQCNQIVNHAHAPVQRARLLGLELGRHAGRQELRVRSQPGRVRHQQPERRQPAAAERRLPEGRRRRRSPARRRCWVFMDNYVHDNNNPNVPATGTAAPGPVGTGMSVSGGRNDTIMHNRFVNNDAWGMIFFAVPGQRQAVHRRHAELPLLGKGSCLYDDWGDPVLNNTFTNNGFFGNPTNGDFEQLNLETHPTNCFAGNTDTRGSAQRGGGGAAADATRSAPATTVPPNLNLPFLHEIVCDTGVKLPPFGCQPGDHYPRQTKIVMHPLPKGLKTMPNPCKGVPANPWCKRGKPA